MTRETKGLFLIAGSYVLLLVIPHFFHFSYENETLKYAVGMLVYLFLALLGCYVLRRQLRENLLWIRQHKLKSLGIVLLVFLAMTLLGILGSLLAQFGYSLLNLSQIKLTNDTNISIAAKAMSLPLLILALGLLGPFVEEVVYRYILMRCFKRFCPAGLAIFLSSLCFALIHVSYFTANELLGVLPHFMMGLVFAYTYHKTDNLLFSSAVHILHNSSLFLLM